MDSGLYEMNIMGGFSCWPRFDPFAYAADIKGNPENYVSMASIVLEEMNKMDVKLYEIEVLRQIDRCDTLEELQRLFSEQYRSAKAEGRKLFMECLIERKNARKEHLADAALLNPTSVGRR